MPHSQVICGSSYLLGHPLTSVCRITIYYTTAFVSLKFCFILLVSNHFHSLNYSFLNLYKHSDLYKLGLLTYLFFKITVYLSTF